jgi:hypothetical protein
LFASSATLAAALLLAAGPPGELRLARFDIDCTPPVGSQMAYDPVKAHGDVGLRARGVVLLGAGEPIVLCAVDWIGIANEAHDAFRQALAEAASTRAERVAVHALHQHDAPDCDFSAEQILLEAGVAPRQFDSGFQRSVLSDLAAAVRASLEGAQPVTHVGWGTARTEQIASNRRVMGPDGRVKAVRYTACPDPALRAEPEGTIDPVVSLVSFWNGDRPLAVLSYFATHPQSYYRTGIPNPDFPGLARLFRQLAVPEALHVHFTGAGGNIGAGKYNDGAPRNRLVLAERLADGMRRAWEATERMPITPAEVAWRVEPVRLPPSRHLNEAELLEQIQSGQSIQSATAATRLAWLRRCQAGHAVELAGLDLGPISILHLPGELFVEYQLAAQAQRPDRHVAVAAYGDYGPWYIGTEVAYGQGGYETSPTASNVAPNVEPVLTAGINRLLGGSPGDKSGQP